MRTPSVIVLLLFIFAFVMADMNRFDSYARQQTQQRDTLGVGGAMSPNKRDSAFGKRPDSVSADSTTLDSLQLAIRKHNQQVDDSIRLDSLNKKKANGIDAPVQYTADDSLVYDAKSRTTHLYGSSTVKYEDMDLKLSLIHI